MKVSKKPPKVRGMLLLFARSSKQFLFKIKCRRQRQLSILWHRGNKTDQGSGGTKHEEDSTGPLLAILICSSTTIRILLFATLYADRKTDSPFQPLRTRRRQTVETEPIDFYYFTGHAIGYR